VNEYSMKLELTDSRSITKCILLLSANVVTQAYWLKMYIIICSGF